MIITCRALFQGGQIHNLEPAKLARLRLAHHDGDELTVTFSDDKPDWNEQQSRLFHALVRAYSIATAEPFDEVKVKFKVAHGPRRVFVSQKFEPPDWKAGAFVLIDGIGFVYLKSITCYTRDEWHALIEGTIQDCYDAQVGIEPIMEGVSQ